MLVSTCMTLQIGAPIPAASLPDRRRLHLLRALKLTERQLECLYWTQQGKSAGDIGLILGISPRTVEGHLAKACRILGVRTRLQAVLKVKELDLF